MSVVDVELLVVPDCPNESVALSVLRLAFDRVGLVAQSVRTTVIASQEQAQERGFVGSPTILINGVDPFGAHDGSRREADLLNAAGGPGSPPAGDHVVRCHEDVSMTLGIYSNASPMATLEAKRRLGEPLRALL